MKTRIKLLDILMVVAAISLAGYFAPAKAFGEEGVRSAGERSAFEGSRSEVVRFMKYYRTIRLTPEEKAVRDKALEVIPAPCCSDYSMATCCCECNLARSVWGLSNYLIRHEKKTEDEVRARVKEWLGAISPGGHTGNVCPTGGCGRSIASGACGGMIENQLIFR